MLAEATQHVPPGFQIDWREADAAALPFAAAAFDVVLCQQGRAVFPREVRGSRGDASRAGAGRAGDGQRLAIVGAHPFLAIVAEALGQHLAPEFETMIAAPFAYGDAAVLAALFGEAASRTSPSTPRSRAATTRAMRSEWRGCLRSLPMAEAVAAMPEAAREAMIADIIEGIPGDATAPAVLSPQSTNVLKARRAEDP